MECVMCIKNQATHRDPEHNEPLCEKCNSVNNQIIDERVDQNDN